MLDLIVVAVARRHTSRHALQICLLPLLLTRVSFSLSTDMYHLAYPSLIEDPSWARVNP